jgi:hypothetical protein
MDESNHIIEKIESTQSNLITSIQHMRQVSNDLRTVYFRCDKQMIPPSIMNNLINYDFNGLEIKFV